MKSGIVLIWCSVILATRTILSVTQRVHVLLPDILRPESAVYTGTPGPKCLIHGYLDPLGYGWDPIKDIKHRYRYEDIDVHCKRFGCRCCFIDTAIRYKYRYTYK